MEKAYPDIKEQAKAENAQIWWGDETAVKPEAHTRRSFAPKGKNTGCSAACQTFSQ